MILCVFAKFSVLKSAFLWYMQISIISFSIVNKSTLWLKLMQVVWQIELLPFSGFIGKYRMSSSLLKELFDSQRKRIVNNLKLVYRSEMLDGGHFTI